MRLPERWRNVALAAFLLGPPLGYAAFALPGAGDGLRAMLFSLGLGGVVFGGVGVLVYQQRVRAKRQLGEGQRLLARWRVAPEAWREFLALDAARNADGERWLPNEFTPRAEVPAQDIEILVGEEAVQIDGSLHHLPRHGTPQVTRFELDEARARPTVVEFELLYPGSGNGEVSAQRRRLCFPVPRGSEQEAARIVAHFGQLTPGRPTFFHGRGDGSDPEDLSTCWKCGFQTHRFIDTCERCGAGLLSRRWARRFGGVLVLLGLPLTIGMAWLLAALWPTLRHPGVQVGPDRFDGSAADARLVLALLFAVLAFGVIASGYGAWQVATGRRNLQVVYVLVVIVGALCATALVL